ncbi:unnamed protein product [Caenorhabditis sp. 36 PRJEB53466]|nr:unnamed protein product [Caenorhabditis sp. 36 PRJEB53466]
MASILVLVAAVLSICSPVQSYNFLVVSPSFGHSHCTFLGKVADSLAESGHNVTLLSIQVTSNFRNVSYSKSVKDLVYIETTEEIDRLGNQMESGDLSRFWSEEGSMLETIPSYTGFMSIFDKVMDNLRANVHVLDEMQKTRPKFDVIVFEGFMFMGKAIQDYLEIPVFLPVASVTHDNRIAELLGEPVNPSYLSGYFTNFGNVMNFQERATNTISYFLGKWILQWPEWSTLRDPKKIMEIESVYHSAPFIFINSNPYIDFPRPMITKTVQIGGITVDVNELRSKKVDEKWNAVLNKRPHSILISFGSMFHSIYMPDSYKANFVRVMTSLPNVTFIWKYESEDTGFAGGADNIVFSKWVPQKALLADSRLSAFLTHGGLGSVNELSYLGKPAILCPLFADQLRNAKMLTRHNGSIEISKFDLPKYGALRTAFHNILYDESFKANAENLAKRLENQPMKPKELLVRHAEFAAQFGEQPGLDCNIRNMSFVEYFLIDVVALFAAVGLLILATLYFVLLNAFGGVRDAEKIYQSCYLLYKKSMAEAMKNFPEVTFIWKYETDDPHEFAEHTHDIHFSKRVPQISLLVPSVCRSNEKRKNDHRCFQGTAGETCRVRDEMFSFSSCPFDQQLGIRVLSPPLQTTDYTLSDAGHNVTFFTPIIVKKFARVQYVKSTKDVIHLEPSKKLEEYGASMEDKDFSRFWTDDSSISEMLPALQLFHNMYAEQANVLRDNLELLDELKARKFDAMIFESFVLCSYPLLDYLEIKTFLPSISVVYDLKLSRSIGEPVMPSAVSLPLSKSTDRMSLFERLVSTVTPPIIDFFLPMQVFTSFRAPFEPIDIASVEPQSSFIFTNSNPFIDYPRPVITKNVQIGGISVDMERLKNQKVNEEWDRILSLRPKTVLVSFGSVMLSKDMPMKYKSSLVRAMRKFPEVTFIWKYETDDTESFSERTANIHFSTWVPQTALLADSRLSAFFTHAGLGSINEVSYLGKPTILCPIFADQMRNAKMLSRHNGSIELSKYDLADPDRIEEALRTIVFDVQYKQAAENLAHQLANQPTKPKDLLLKHAEFAAQFGRLPSLDPYSRQMSFVEYFLIDVAAIVVASVLLVLFVLYRLSRLLISCLPFTIADILTEAGHNVTLFTPTIVTEFRNFTYTKLTEDVVHLDPSPKLKAIGDLIAGNKRWWNQEFSVFEVPQTADFFQSVNQEQHAVLAVNLPILDELKKRKFDVMLFESMFACAFPLMEYLEIKTFSIAGSISYDSMTASAMGEPTTPSFIPNLMAQSSDRMSLYERFMNALIGLSTDIFSLVPNHFSDYKDSTKKIYPSQRMPHSSFFFMNSNPYLDFTRPTLSKNIQIGGISVDLKSLKSGKVEEQWDKVLNEREKTMLISFGSVILSKDMPMDKKVAMAKAMSKFPQVTFIWKYEADDVDSFAKGIQNIHFAKWIPQREVLADARLSAFMTHGGLGSINEVSYLGKPTITCPIFADQMRNAKMLARHNGSIEITKYKLSDPIEIEQVFQKILYDESYALNAKRLADHLEFQPFHPKELFLKHAEFAARFGRLPSLDPYSRQMTFIEFYLLDVLAIVLTVVLSIVLSLIYAFKLITGALNRKQKNE